MSSSRLISMLLILFSLVSFSYADLNQTSFQDDPSQPTRNILKDPISLSPEARASNKTLFNATNDWQTYDSETQILPEGMWVRANLTSGKMEARLLDNKEEENTALIVTPQKEIHSNDFKLPELTYAHDRTHVQSLNETERTLRLKALGKYLGGHTDEVRIMQQLVAVLISPTSTFVESLAALNTLESMVHQVDLAVDWTKSSGIDVLLPILKTSSWSLVLNSTGLDQNELKSEVLRLLELQLSALWTLGSAAQNNLAVKEHALSSGVLPVIMGLYRELMQNQAQNVAILNDTEVVKKQMATQAKAIYALSSIIRNFQKAQNVFRNLGGVQILKDNISFYSNEQNVDNSARKKLVVKTVSLIRDLLTDRWENSEQEDFEREVRESADRQNEAEINDMNLLNDTISSSLVLYHDLISPPMCQEYRKALDATRSHVQFIQGDQENQTGETLSPDTDEQELEELMSVLKTHQLCLQDAKPIEPVTRAR